MNVSCFWKVFWTREIIFVCALPLPSLLHTCGLFMCACLYVCMFAYMHVCLCICMYVFVYFMRAVFAFVHMRPVYVCSTYVCMYVCMYACMYVCVFYVCRAFVSAHACCVCMRAFFFFLSTCTFCTCARTFVYVYVYMHVRMHAPMYLCMYVCM